MRSSIPYVCASNAFIVFASCLSVWEATADLVVLSFVASSDFVLSSAFPTLSSRSSTSFSRCSIFSYSSLLYPSWSNMSFWSWVTSLSRSFIQTTIYLFVSSWANLTRIASSAISLTVSSNLFPAVWTTCMESSALFFHVLSSFCTASILATNAA